MLSDDIGFWTHCAQGFSYHASILKWGFPAVTGGRIEYLGYVELSSNFPNTRHTMKKHPYTTCPAKWKGIYDIIAIKKSMHNAHFISKPYKHQLFPSLSLSLASSEGGNSKVSSAKFVVTYASWLYWLDVNHWPYYF